VCKHLKNAFANMSQQARSKPKVYTLFTVTDAILRNHSFTDHVFAEEVLKNIAMKYSWK
jgi:hypothetical protein